LAEILRLHAERVPSNPADPVFPPPLNDYSSARSSWRKTCLQAGLHNCEIDKKKRKPNATLHDLRHTFGVLAAQAGVPIVRLQKLMGHSSPVMTMRYMKHAPESFFEEDAASIANMISGGGDVEQQERSPLANKGLRKA
jgi:integrase